MGKKTKRFHKFFLIGLDKMCHEISPGDCGFCSLSKGILKEIQFNVSFMNFRPTGSE